MAEKKKKWFPGPRYPRLVCENGHLRFNEDDAICPSCHTDFRIHPGLGLTLEVELRIMTDYGLIRCPNLHFYNSKSTTCPRCNPEPPRSSTETLLAMADSVPPPVDASPEPAPAPIPTPTEDPEPKDEAELLASDGFEMWVSDEDLGLTMPTSSSGRNSQGPSRNSNAPTGNGRWVWYPFVTSPRSTSHSPPRPEGSRRPAPPVRDSRERQEEDDEGTADDDGEGVYWYIPT